MLSPRGRHVRTLALFFLAVFGFTSTQASAAERAGAKLDRLLSARARQLTGRSRVIVEFRGSPDVRAITSAHGVAARTMRGRPAQVAEISNLDLLTLANDPRVSRVMADRPAFALLERTAAAIGIVPTGTAATDVIETGRGVGIALIDSGVNAQHDDLWRSSFGQRVVAFKDFTTAPSSSWTNVPPRDGFGHGTHVAGILAGNGYDSSGRRRGVARRANLIALKALDDEGFGFVSNVIEAIDYAVANRTALGIRVINLSIGAGVYESYDTDPLAQATKRAVDAGIVVVTSAGNLGENAQHEPQFGGITSPGNAPWVLTVGASSHQGTVTRADDAVAPFSSRGPTWLDFSAKPDLVAPGVGIESLADPHSVLYGELQNYLLDGTRTVPYKPYLSLTGTSMAAPVVAGTVALMLEANPSLTPNAVKAILQYTAEARARSPLAEGAGFVNARGALRLARFFARPQNGLGAPVDTIAGKSIKWARHLVWGNYRVTGGVPLPGSNAWATNVVWGESRTPSGALVVWGAANPDNVVWGERQGDNVVWGELTGDNVVWGESGNDNVVWGETHADNVVWGEADADNVVWGESCGGRNCANNVVWGEAEAGNVVWGERQADNVVWGENQGDNVVWGESGNDNVVWGEALRAFQMLWPH
jgi:serine protease AprX